MESKVRTVDRAAGQCSGVGLDLELATAVIVMCDFWGL